MKRCIELTRTATLAIAAGIAMTIVGCNLDAADIKSEVDKFRGGCIVDPKTKDVIGVIVSELSNADGVLNVCRRDKRIVTLIFNNATVSASGYEALGEMPWLKSLTFNGSGASDEYLANIGKLVELESLGISRSSVTDDGLSHLKGLVKLATLSLQNTQVTGKGLRHLRNAMSLKQLALDGSPVTDRGLHEIRQLQSLKKIFLSQTKVSNAGLLSLVKMPQLEHLRVTGSEVTPEGVEEFHRQRKKEYADRKPSQSARVQIELAASAPPSTPVASE